MRQHSANNGLAGKLIKSDIFDKEIKCSQAQLQSLMAIAAYPTPISQPLGTKGMATVRFGA